MIMRVRLEQLGLHEDQWGEGSWFGLKRNDGKVILQPEYRFIADSGVLMKRRGFVVEMQRSSGYYGLIILQPKMPGYWNRYNEGYEWFWDPTTSWKVLPWPEELCKELGGSHKKICYQEGKGGWWSSQTPGDNRWFDCLGNVRSETNKSPKYPEPFGMNDEDDDDD